MGTKIVVVPAEIKKITEGGVHLPDDVLRPEMMGTVLAVGEDVDRTKLDEGARVLFPQYAGTEVKLEDDKGDTVTLLVMDFAQIIAKIETLEEVTTHAD